VTPLDSLSGRGQPRPAPTPSTAISRAWGPKLPRCWDPDLGLGNRSPNQNLPLHPCYTHTFPGPLSGTRTTPVIRYRKGKTNDLKPTTFLKQETVSVSGISWAIRKSAPSSRQISTPAPHPSFLQAYCPLCHPTNSIKALKANLFLYSAEY